MSSGAVRVEFLECDPQPACPSLDPGTRVKTHVVRASDDAGVVLWERSVYSQYDTREIFLTPTKALVGYDDRVAVLDRTSGQEDLSHRMYLFEYFEDVAPSPGHLQRRVLVKEKGSCLMLDDLGRTLWENIGENILGGVLVAPPYHAFLHYWGGSLVAGLRVPFQCLLLETGQPDVAGPTASVDFSQLAHVRHVAGPNDAAGLETMRGTVRELARLHPTPWVISMQKFIGA